MWVKFHWKVQQFLGNKYENLKKENKLSEKFFFRGQKKHKKQLMLRVLEPS